jgi:PhnB protein
MAVNYKPAGTQSVIPYLVVADAEKELDFVKRVFDAQEAHISRDPGGRIAHADLKIGDSTLMMAQASDQWKALPTAIYIYVPDVDKTYREALAAGATSVMEPADQFYGDRNGGVKDANGIQWWLGTHIEDLSEEELRRRTTEAFKKRAHG